MSGFCLLLLYPVNVTAFTKASGSRSRISANKSWLYTQTYMFSLCFVRCLSIQLNCFKPQLPFIQLRWCCFILFFLNVFSSELVTPPPIFFNLLPDFCMLTRKKNQTFVLRVLWFLPWWWIFIVLCLFYAMKKSLLHVIINESREHKRVTCKKNHVKIHELCVVVFLIPQNKWIILENITGK